MELQGIWLFGKYIVPGDVLPPILPPVNQEQEQEQEQEKEKRAPVVVKRIVFKLDGNRFPCPLFSPVLRNLLSTLQISKKRRPRHVITRALTACDVDKGKARLTIPRKKINKRFLKDYEEKLLEERDGEGKLRRVEVDVVDPMLEVRALNLVRWNYKKPADPNAQPKTWSYVLNSGWTDVVDNNRLVVGNIVQVWSFRKSGGSLGFIIFKV